MHELVVPQLSQMLSSSSELLESVRIVLSVYIENETLITHECYICFSLAGENRIFTSAGKNSGSGQIRVG